MGRRRKKPLFPVALSLASAVDALDGVRRKYLADHIAEGTLPAHIIDQRTRIAVADLVAFLKSHPLKGVRHAKDR
jgi:hypothetical protein